MIALLVAAVVVAVAAGPLLAGLGVRLAAGYRTRPTAEDAEADVLRGAVGPPPPPPSSLPPPADRPGAVRVAAVTLVLAVLLAGAALLVGARPFLLALAWGAGAAVVLAQVDLAVHRLPDRVVFPSAAVVAVAGLADAVVTGSWDQFSRSVLAGAAALAVSAGLALIGPGMGFGDVKLLGLLGLLLGWFGWPVLLLGVLLGFGVGAVVSLALMALRRAGWRTEIALGPSLLAGAALALGLPALLPPV